MLRRCGPRGDVRISIRGGILGQGRGGGRERYRRGAACLERQQDLHDGLARLHRDRSKACRRVRACTCAGRKREYRNTTIQTKEEHCAHNCVVNLFKYGTWR